MILATALALLLMINGPESAPTLDEKHAEGMDACLYLADEFGYDACLVELSADETKMWFHMMCSSWDTIHESEVYDEYAIIDLAWVDGNRLIVTRLPELSGCPEFI